MSVLFPIVATYKGANVRRYGTRFVVVYQKGYYVETAECKTIASAKRWITRNRSWFTKPVTFDYGKITCGLRRDTKFF